MQHGNTQITRLIAQHRLTSPPITPRAQYSAHVSFGIARVRHYVTGYDHCRRRSHSRPPRGCPDVATKSQPNEKALRLCVLHNTLYCPHTLAMGMMSLRVYTRWFKKNQQCKMGSWRLGHVPHWGWKRGYLEAFPYNSCYFKLNRVSEMRLTLYACVFDKIALIFTRGLGQSFLTVAYFDYNIIE